jgi:hypothetical protein
MATAITALLAKVESPVRGVYIQEWTATVSGRGNPLHAAYLPDKTVQMQGPTGGTSQIIIEGTNGSVVSTATWITLTTPTDGDLSFTNVTGGTMKVIRENPLMIRPHFSVVTGGTMTVRIVAR